MRGFTGWDARGILRIDGAYVVTGSPDRSILARTCHTCDELTMTANLSPTCNRKAASFGVTTSCKSCRNKRRQDRLTSEDGRRTARRQKRRTYKRKRMQTADAARRARYQWTGPEFEVISRTDLTRVEMAIMLGRSLAAVTNARRRLGVTAGKERRVLDGATTS